MPALLRAVMYSTALAHTKHQHRCPDGRLRWCRSRGCPCELSGPLGNSREILLAPVLPGCWLITPLHPHQVEDYNSFATAMLTLFGSMLGNFDFTLFDGLDMAHVGGRGLGTGGQPAPVLLVGRPQG